MTRASFAGVSPRESRTSSARGTSTSTSIRAIVELVDRHRLGRDLEVEPVCNDEPVDHVEVGCVAAVHARDDAVLDDELGLGIVGPFAATSPSSGSGETSCSRCRSRVAREANRAGYGIAQQTPLGVRERRLANERRRLVAPSRRAGRPTPRAPRRWRAPAAAPCRSPADGRPAPCELRCAFEVLARAASGRRRARPRPAAGASPAWRGSRRRRAARRRIAASVTSSSRTPAGVADEIRAAGAERVVAGRIEGHSVETLGFARVMGNAERFSGKVALVTGGASGIGAAVAAACATRARASPRSTSMRRRPTACSRSRATSRVRRRRRARSRTRSASSVPSTSSSAPPAFRERRSRPST